MEIHLSTTLEPHGPATAIELTDEQVAALGAGKRAPVVVTIGERSARLRLAVTGGKNLIRLSKAARAELAVEIGDQVDAIVAVDTVERSVEVPDDLAAALDSVPGARAVFDALPPSRRKEHVTSVIEAKQAATRERRSRALWQHRPARPPGLTQAEPPRSVVPRCSCVPSGQAGTGALPLATGQGRGRTS